jgi:RNA polymerase sigma-70 factor (ECF subfamily)
MDWSQLAQHFSSAQEGDVDAFAVFAERVEALLFWTARRIVRNAEDARDVVQNTLLRAWMHRANFDTTQGTLATWLLMILRCAAIDVWRRNNAHPTVSLNGAIACDGPGQEAMMDAAEEWERLQRALELLDPRDRELVRRRIEGQSYDTISAETSIPKTTIGPALTRARMQLREILNPTE